MTREDVNNLALSKIDNTKCLILELITGMGKTRLAINLINHICDRVFKEHQSPTSVLILVAKTVHKQTWNDEIKKWGGLNTDYLTIECYESLKKYKDRIFDVVIADEMQHLSNARLEILSSITINEAFIGLSATIKREIKDIFKYKYNASFIKCDLKEAVKDSVLPEPVVYILPLELDDREVNYKITKFKKTYLTTQKGYYNSVSTLIEWYKNKYFRCRSERIKNLWLSTAGKRLKWLSEQKERIVLNMLSEFKKERTLTFCSSIEQSERLGKYSINSKNKNSVDSLIKFNERKINHITAVNILNEGINLTDCRIGIFCNLNSSEIIVKQRIGRILRHKKPIIIIPYFENTREEELLETMLEEYTKETIKVINNLNEIVL